jgi:hypothetical protein
MRYRAADNHQRVIDYQYPFPSLVFASLRRQLWGCSEVAAIAVISSPLTPANQDRTNTLGLPCLLRGKPQEESTHHVTLTAT